MSSDCANSFGSEDPPAQVPDQAQNKSSNNEQGASILSVRKRRDRTKSRQGQDHGPVTYPSSNGSLLSSSYENRFRKDNVTPKKHRSSSGFLLDHAGLPARLAFLSRSKHNGGKGKGTSAEGSPNPVSSNRTSYRSRISSIGGSPLATKVSTPEDIQHDAGHRPAEDGGDSRGSEMSPSSKTNSIVLEDERAPLSSKAVPRYSGYDTDPTQIVNMALTLNEGRRRQASGLRLTSADKGTRLSNQMGPRTDLISGRHQSRLPGRLDSTGQLPRHTPAESQPGGLLAADRDLHEPRSTNASYLQPSAIEETEVDLDGFYDISDATIARVQKAKDHFELLYEHRRLLPHLPPLREASRTLQTSYSEGRSYNPLQCARNRKIRHGEKRSPDGDAEGWHDIQHVRSWVDAIIENHTEPRNDPDQCIRLPAPYHLHTDGDQGNTDVVGTYPPALSPLKPTTSQKTKPRRPQCVWVVPPPDLLADLYWLEQGLNKTKLEDRDGNKIYHGETPLKFTTWRSRTPAHGQGQQSPSQTSRSEESRKPAHASPPSPLELPTFTSAGRKVNRRGRKSQRGVKKERSFDSDKSRSESQTRSKRLKKHLIGSLRRASNSESDSSGSDSDRGRRLPKVMGRKEKHDLTTESSAVESYVRQSLDHDATPISRARVEDELQKSSARTLLPAVDHRPDVQASSSRERATLEPPRGPDGLPGSLDGSFRTRRQPPSTLEVDKAARSSLDYDSTAESSPAIPRFPGIATNLSTSASSSPSPRKKKLTPSIGVRNQSKRRKGIDAADFADTPSSTSPYHQGNEPVRSAESSAARPRDISPMTKTARRSSEVIFAADDHQRPKTSASQFPAKSSPNPDTMTRIRGILKGGRIGELVGNEVSRVGDFIWKREPPPPPSSWEKTASPSDTESNLGSDHEERRANGQLRQLPRSHAGRELSGAEQTGRNVVSSQSRPAFQDRSSYFINNLPNFTSPFQKDRGAKQGRDPVMVSSRQSPPSESPADVFISHAATHDQSIPESPRLDDLAPAKLDNSRSSSPNTSLDSRRRNYDLHQSSALVGPMNASRVLSRVLSQGGLPVSGVTQLKHSKSGNDLQQNWDISSLKAEKDGLGSKSVAKRDLARAYALLLSSGTKAYQISLRANTTRCRSSSHLVNSVSSSSASKSPNTSSFQNPHECEYQLAAQSLISSLNAHAANLHNSVTRFTQTTSPTLHSSLQTLDERVENNLTPRVRTVIDSTGDLSMKLTTTCTLAVRGLNDTIEMALRRQRRARAGPLKWLRRLGFGIVEWMVVSLLWLIWSVVMVVRVVRGTMMFFWWGVKWLVWIE